AVSVKLNEEAKSAFVVVPDNQLSLAIGKAGQNVRLAARLTGWRIDIRSEAQVARAALLAMTDHLGEEEEDDEPVTIGSTASLAATESKEDTIVIGAPPSAGGNGHAPSASPAPAAAHAGEDHASNETEGDDDGDLIPDFQGAAEDAPAV